MDDSWAIEKLAKEIREDDKIIKEMSKEICKLRGLIICDNNISLIISEFKNRLKEN